MKAKAQILIVEDDDSVARLMADLLTRSKYAVTMAKNGVQGIQLAQHGRYDLITLDVDLPDVNGFELYRHLREQTHLRHIPMIFVSGRSDEEDIQCGLKLGAADYITKPFKAGDFIFRVISHLKRGDSRLTG